MMKTITMSSFLESKCIYAVFRKNKNGSYKKVRVVFTGAYREIFTLRGAKSFLEKIKSGKCKQYSSNADYKIFRLVWEEVK